MCLDTKAQPFSKKHFLPTQRTCPHHAFLHPVGHLLIGHSFIHSFTSCQWRPYHTPGNAQALGIRGLKTKRKREKRSFCLHGTYSLIEGERCYLNNQTNIEFTNCDKCYKWTVQETMQHTVAWLVQYEDPKKGFCLRNSQERKWQVWRTEKERKRGDTGSWRVRRKPDSMKHINTVGPTEIALHSNCWREMLDIDVF